MTGRPTAAKGFPWLMHRTVAQAMCGKCGRELDHRNRSGFCLSHRQAAESEPPENFAALAEAHYASDLARILGVDARQIYRWARRGGIALRIAPKGGAALARIQALTYAPAPAQLKAFCAQCDRRVSADQAASCRSQFCKAKVAA